MEDQNYKPPLQSEFYSTQIHKHSNIINIIFLVIILALTILFAVGIFIIGNTANPSLIYQRVAIISIPPAKDTTSSCPATVTDIDSNTYNTVKIGTQCWMKENLKVTKNPSGKGIVRYCYDNDTNICNTDGGLYDWNTTINGSAGCNGSGASQPQCATPVQGICPVGWHIPSHYEWTTLEKNVGSNPDAFLYDEAIGGKVGTDEGKNLIGNGSSGFKAVLAGTRAVDDEGVIFMLRGKATDFWSSTNFVDKLTKDEGVLVETLNSTSPFILRSTSDKKYGSSVRCLRD